VNDGPVETFDSASGSQFATPRAGRTAPAPTLLSVSAAARMLGVSPSSLRAWAAAGRVPHVRTPGGHRRFPREELVRWLTDRGGAPPAQSNRAPELVPTRIERMPSVAADVHSQANEVLAVFETELGRSRAGGVARPSASRHTRVLGTLQTLAEALDRGDLGPCFREAEWEGFRHGAAGQSAEGPLTEALALRRAVDRVLAATLAKTPDHRRTIERALDRMAVRVAAGFADGVRARLRSSSE
jgi:excisionase family DNA binding protein